MPVALTPSSATSAVTRKPASPESSATTFVTVTRPPELATTTALPVALSTRTPLSLPLPPTMTAQDVVRHGPTALITVASGPSP